MTSFWLGVIAGGVFGAILGLLVAGLLTSAKTSALYAEIEWSRHREQQLRGLEKSVRGK